MDSEINGANPVFYGNKHSIYLIIHPLSTQSLFQIPSRSQGDDSFSCLKQLPGTFFPNKLPSRWLGHPRRFMNFGQKYGLFSPKIRHITLLTYLPFSHKFIRNLMPYFSAKFLGVDDRENSNGIMMGPQKG